MAQPKLAYLIVDSQQISYWCGFSPGEKPCLADLRDF